MLLDISFNNRLIIVWMKNVTITNSYMTFTSPISISTGVCYSIPTGAGMAWCSAYISARNIRFWQQQYNNSTNWIDWHHNILAIGYT